ncbi:MAG: SurA N-terminal domain-containing protein, partial [Alphaproteobacteria bacterium]
MLQFFRNMADTKLTKWLLGLLVVSFAMWGVQDYIGGSSGGAALTVNGREIPLSEVDAVYRNRVKVVGQMMGKAPSPAELEQLNVPQMVLTELVHRHVLNAATAELELTPAASVLRAEISNTEVFQQNGVFSPERYKRMLTAQGMTTRAYEKMLGEQLGLAMMADLLALPQPKAEAILPILKDAETTYTVEAFTLAPTAVTGVEQPTEETLQGFYTTNSPAYAIPEKRSFKVLTLNPETMAGTITLSDGQIDEHFNANKASYQQPERRHVRHIVVAESAKAVELTQQITTREAFIQQAEAHTIDPSGKGKGGDMGIIAATDVVPAFAEAAFALPVNTLSAPVKTSFGWHLIWVDDIIPPAEPVLANVR